MKAAQITRKTSTGKRSDPTSDRIGVWIDTAKAHIIPLNGKVRTVSMDMERHKRILKAKLRGLRGGSPSRSEKQEQSGLDAEMRKYMAQVIGSIGAQERIVVLGPAYVKNELGKALAADPRFKKTTVELVTADQMTPSQMVAWVKHYFKQA